MMRPRLVEISSLHAIVDIGGHHNVAAFFYGSEEVLLFGSETDMNLVVEEMIFALGYVPRQIKKEVILDADILASKINSAMQLINNNSVIE